jgi:hypothetical protein
VLPLRFQFPNLVLRANSFLIDMWSDMGHRPSSLEEF